MSVLFDSTWSWSRLILRINFASKVQPPPRRDLVDVLVLPVHETSISEHLTPLPNLSARNVHLFEAGMLDIQLVF